LKKVEIYARKHNPHHESGGGFFVFKSLLCSGPAQVAPPGLQVSDGKLYDNPPSFSEKNNINFLENILLVSYTLLMPFRRQIQNPVPDSQIYLVVTVLKFNYYSMYGNTFKRYGTP
jgi:hypothetical protein